MNLLKRKWLNFFHLLVSYTGGKMIIENDSSRHKFLIYPLLFRCNKQKSISLSVSGSVIYGTGCQVKVLNRHKTILASCGLNSLFQRSYQFLKYFIIVIYMPAKSKVEIDQINYSPTITTELDFSRFTSDTLLVTPGYPSLENKYNSAFVHTRVQAYQAAGLNVDVLWINDIHGTQYYSYEGINVVVADFFYLRMLLRAKKYKRILIHFFDQRYANVLESVDVSETHLYFYLHGAETLYWDWPKIASPYFGPPAEIDDSLRTLFKTKDYYIKKYSAFKNARWIFVTPWTRQRCEELVGVQFDSSDAIPCLVNTDLFSYEKKDPQLRKKIFVLRKFADINSYSLDTVVRIILELSRRPFFADLDFDIYGDGPLHETLLAPLTGFENVHVFKGFLDHEQIRQVHQAHGIALFPTRFDSQAVSSCEAAASGCAVISSDIPGVRQFIPTELGVLCSTEDYREYADVIEKMYYDPDFFLETARRESESVCAKFDFRHTIQRELDMFAAEKPVDTIDLSCCTAEPVLTIAIPSYNVEKTLRSTVISILDQRNAGKLEILIVNDGSSDRTAEIAAELQARAFSPARPLIRVINKENGGHGSTINVGLEQARGKYFKIIDGDDTVDSEELAKLIDILETEDSDVVVNNYVEDFAHDNALTIQNPYLSLKPGIQYYFDDLCFSHYGFGLFGPIMSCSSYKTQVLRSAGFKLLEKAYYVDMELNTYVSIFCSTVTYYNLNVYRYFLGQVNQSVSQSSYIRNYKHHENVCRRMVEAYFIYSDRLSEVRKKYLRDQLIFPMLAFQYDLVISKMRNREAFLSLERWLKEYPEFYSSESLSMKKIIFHRATKGTLVSVNNFFEGLCSIGSKKR